MKYWGTILLFLYSASVWANPTVHEAHIVAISQIETNDFHWADDSWLGQDKVFDHGSFAFVLAQMTEYTFKLNDNNDRLFAAGALGSIWALKEVMDGYGFEGASYKDWIWSMAGTIIPLIVH